MANSLYMQLGINPETATLNMPQRLPSEHVPGMGNLWFYTEYTVYRYSENTVKIKYEVYSDKIQNRQTHLTPEEDQVALNIELKYGGGPVKTHWETIELEHLKAPHTSGIQGNDMMTSTSAPQTEMDTMCISPDVATEFAANDNMERAAIRWMNANRDKIIAFYSDIVGASEAIANGKELQALRMASEAMDTAKAHKAILENSKYLKYQKDIESLNKSLDNLRQELLWWRAKAKAAGAAEAAADGTRAATSIEMSIASRGAALHEELMKSTSLVAEELAKNSRAVEEVAEATKGMNTAAEEAKALAGTAKSFGTAGKWLKRAGWAGIALQAGSVVLNGVLWQLAEDEDTRKELEKVFIDSAGGFAFSLGLYVGAGALGGPAGIAIGLCIAGLDVLLLATTGKSLGDWLWEGCKFFVEGWNAHIQQEFNCLSDPNNPYRLCQAGAKY